MVGERYRDLIEAADTIQNMKQTASKVIDSVEEVQGPDRGGGHNPEHEADRLQGD